MVSLPMLSKPNCLEAQKAFDANDDKITVHSAPLNESDRTE